MSVEVSSILEGCCCVVMGRLIYEITQSEAQKEDHKRPPNLWKSCTLAAGGTCAAVILAAYGITWTLNAVIAGTKTK